MPKMRDEIISSVLSFERRAIARAVTLVENNDPSAIELLGALYAHTGRAHRIGITGPPGAGKSTLTSKMARRYREQGLRIGIIAVDPTSPFTGGALLGDRIRMSDVDVDSQVYIRSMASRGSLGGLSRKAEEAADVLDAAGCDVVILETVGVGQSELDIAQTADTTIVVLVPESGDSIQAMKAGLMEIADFFVLNKADRPGADSAAASLKMIVGMKTADTTTGKAVWNPDVLPAIASENKGVQEIIDTVERHKRYLEETGTLRHRRISRLERRINTIVLERLSENFWTPERNAALRKIVHSTSHSMQSPYEIADILLDEFRKTTR